MGKEKRRTREGEVERVLHGRYEDERKVKEGGKKRME